MSRWAISFDVCAKCFEEDGKTKSDRTKFYDYLKACLANHSFDTRMQYSMYSCADDTENCQQDADNALEEIKQIPEYEKYLRSLQLMELNNCSDLLLGCVGEDSDPLDDETIIDAISDYQQSADEQSEV